MAKLVEALQTVYDPEIPVDIVELGLHTRDGRFKKGLVAWRWEGGLFRLLRTLAEGGAPDPAFERLMALPPLRRLRLR